MKEDTINRVNITKHLVKYELEMVGKTLLDTLDDDLWYFNNPMTRNQFVQFKSYAIPEIRKVFKCNKRRAENAFAWFRKRYGLRIEN